MAEKTQYTVTTTNGADPSGIVQDTSTLVHPGVCGSTGITDSCLTTSPLFTYKFTTRDTTLPVLASATYSSAGTPLPLECSTGMSALLVGATDSIILTFSELISLGGSTGQILSQSHTCNHSFDQDHTIAVTPA